MQTSDTIVAISTAPGRGGIGIVRLSGPDARAIAGPLLRLRHELSPGRARFGELVDMEDGVKPNGGQAGGVLDEVVATWFAAPNSYTGEDVVEIAMHGSPVLLEHVVRRCCAGTPKARLAEPGEFTQRAFLAGRIDLTQAEAVGDLIASSTLEQAKLAARQLGGALARQIAPIKAGLLELIATLEAGIDFAEDVIEVAPAAEVVRKFAELRTPLEALERSFGHGRVVREGFRMAIVGRPNAGKSSLFNRLIERDRAIVTPVPGTTRDLVTERVAIDGIPVELVDTAGLRDASDEAERIGIEKSREAMAESDIVLLVLDSTAEMTQQDRDVLAEGIARGVIVARNKVDLFRGSAPELELPPGVASMLTSALTGQGISEIRAAILRAVVGNSTGLREDAMLTNVRQHQAVERAIGGLDAAAAAANANIPHEMLLLDLYEALRGLDALTGATSTEDVLRLIFSSFCIGK